jgi:hypothetical protein
VATLLAELGLRPAGPTPTPGALPAAEFADP